MAPVECGPGPWIGLCSEPGVIRATRPFTRSTLALLSALLLGLTGCDDVILFDVATDGRIVVSADEDGRAAAVGEGKVLRHVCRVDPETGAVERLTAAPGRVAWLQACGQGALYVADGRRLVHLAPDAEPRTLFESERSLFQPVLSGNGRLVAVLEAEKLGVPGELRVLALDSGRTLMTVPDALLGATWAGADLLVPRATAPRQRVFEGGPGELLRVRGQSQEPLLALELPGAVLMSADERVAVASLPLGAADGPVGLAAFRVDRPGTRRGEVTGVCDFWPRLEPGGERVLFTRARPDQPTLEGELRLTGLSALATSTRLPTPGPVVAPRWVGPDRVAFLTRDDHLVVQDLDGGRRLDLTAALARAFAEELR